MGSWFGRKVGLARSGSAEIGQAPRKARFGGIVEELERRLLFSADLATPFLPPNLASPPQPVVSQWQDQQAQAQAGAVSATSMAAQAATRPLELVFVDRNLPDVQDLLKLIQSEGAADRQLEIHWLEADADGIAQITEVLKGRQGIDAVHIISHGADAALQLGSSTLDSHNLTRHAQQLLSWGTALNDQADLLIYGCDVAATPLGQQFLDDIGMLTGADVAASTDDTGARALGGDWDLEYAQGQIESQSLVSALEATTWQHLLALNPAGSETVVNTNTTGAQATTNAHQVAMNANGGYVTIWNQSGNIMAKLFDASGTIVKDEFTVATGTNAKVAMNDSGAFGVTWVNSAGHVVFQRYDSAGTAQGAAITVAQYSTSGASGFGGSSTTPSSPDIAINNAGEFIIAYSQLQVQDNSAFYVEYTHTIAFKGYTAAGVQQGTNGSVTVFSVASDTYGRKSAGSSVIGMNPTSGVFTIAWTSSGSSATSQDVVSARSYLANRATSGTTFQVNTTAGSTTVTTPVVAVNGSGQAVVAWTRTASSNSDIYFRRATGAGATIGAQTMAHASATNNQTTPDVAIDRATGQFSIVYQDSSGSNDIYMNQFASDGTALGSTAIVNTTTAGSQTIPSVSRNGGMAVVIWTGPSTTTDVYARFFQGTNNAPTLTATASNPSFTEGAGLGVQGAAVNVYSGAAVSTVDGNQGITSLTFTISGLLDGASERIVVDGTTITLGANSSGTTATNSLSYTVTIASGTATVVLTHASGVSASAIQTLLNSLSYQNTIVDIPTTGNRVFTLTQIKDSGGTADGGIDTTALAVLSTVAVLARNDAPTLSTTALSPTFTEAAGTGTQAAAVSVFSGTSISTVESGQLITSLTFTLSGITNGASERVVVDGTTITLGANSSGTTATNGMSYTVSITSGTATITLTKAAGITTAATQTLVDSITYQNTATDAPTAGNRVFTITQLKDSGGTTNGGSDTATLSTASTVSVLAVNDAPTLSATALNPSFTEAAGAGTQAAVVSVFSGTSASTVESGQTLTSLTFTISGIVDGASERISVDGTTITLGANSSGTTATNAMSYTVTISSGTATITLTKAAGISAANMQTLVNGITYQNTSTDNPTAGNRIFTLTQVKDNGGTANGGNDTTTLATTSTVAVVTRNDAPTLTATALSPTFTEAAGTNTQAAAVSVFSGAAASTVEPGQTITSLTFTVSGIVNGASERIVVDGTTITLGANSSGTTATNGMSYTVTIASGTATVTLTKAAGITTAATQALVNAITYQNTSRDNPTAGNRVFTITQVKDSGGTANGGIDTTTLAIASTVAVVTRNDAPTLTATASNPTFTEAAGASTQAAAVNVFSGTATSTVETGQTITSLTFTVSGIVNGASERIVVDGTTITLGANSSGTTATNAMSYTVAISGGTATLTLTKAAGISAAATNTLINAITYQNTSTDNPTSGNRVFTLTQVRDSGGTANSGNDTTTLAIASTVTVTAVNDAPTLSATGSNPTFTEAPGAGTQAAAVGIFSGTAISAIESGHTITSLTFTLGGLLDGASERIVVDGTTITLGANSSGTTATNVMSYSVSISSGTATITLTKGAGISAANAQTLINGITYQNTNTDNPSAGSRIFTLTQIKDNGGTANGGNDTTTLAVTSTVTVTAVNDNPVATNDVATVGVLTIANIAVKANDTDADDPIANLNVTIVSFSTGISNATVNPDGSIRVEAGGTVGDETVIYYLTDGNGQQSANATLTVTISGSPPASGTNGSTTILEDGSFVLSAVDFGFVPADLAQTFDGIRVVTAPASGTLRLNGVALVNGSTVSIADIDAGLLVYTPAADANGTPYASFTFQVRDNFGTYATAPNTFTLSVTGVNDAPVLTGDNDFTTITEDDTSNAGQLVSSLITSSDVESGATNGMAIHGLAASRGSWQYSLNGGADWTTIGTVSDSAALLLRASDYIRFVPDGLNADTASLSFYAWDATSGTVGTTADVSTRGGATAYSSASGTASITVSAANDAPMLTSANNFTAITENQASSNGQLVSSLINTTDVDTGAVGGIAIDTLSSGNGTWQYSTDNGNNWSAVGAVSNTSALLLRGTDLLRFVPDGQNADAASIGFVAWDTTSGTAGTKVNASTAGGSTAFSTQHLSSGITVTDINDAPLIGIVNDFTSITEDDRGNAGQLVSSLLSSTDVDDGAISGIAIHGQVAGNGHWQYSIDDGATWSDVGSVSNTSALLLRSSDHLRFVPDGQNADTASLSFYAWDQSTGTHGTSGDASSRGASTAFSAIDGTANLSVTGVNDAPVLTGANDFNTVTENATSNAGQLVSSLIDATDIDTGTALGVAIYNLSPSNGTWQYSRDGGGTWADIGAVSGTSALLLEGTDRLRFVPDGENADTASLSFYAWDQSTGVAGTTLDVSTRGNVTAFSTMSGTASISVSAVNDAPVLTGSNDFTDITEDDTSNAGQLVSTLLNSSDVDNAALIGIAIHGQSAGNGRWQYSLDSGGTWSALGTVSDNAARLLRSTDLLRFIPDGENADAASLSFYAWDQSTGSAGGLADTNTRGGNTAFSSSDGSASITITAINDAPLIGSANNFNDITEDSTNNAGQLVSSILGSTDVDTGASRGIAVHDQSPSNGTWQYSLDGGSSWTALGTVSGSSALLLRSTDYLRFVPDGQNADSASLSFHAWDQTTGTVGNKVDISVNGGTTAFSSGSATSSIAITAVNDAPVLDGTNNLTSVIEDNVGNTGTRVSALIDGHFSSIDASEQTGIAITAVDNTNGTWQFTTDGGLTWSAMGAVSDSSARLLSTDSTTSVRFVTNANWSGTATITFRAWDRTAGTEGGLANASVNGGITAFSTADATAMLNIIPDNDAPVLTGSIDFTTITEDNTNNAGQLVSTLFSSTDIDSGAITGLAIHAQTTSNGSWQFSTDGGGTWQSLGTVSSTDARLLRSTDYLRFVPDGISGGSASLSFYAWDQTTGSAGGTADVSLRGDTRAYSVSSGTTSITITSINDAPVVSSSGGSASYTEGDAAVVVDGGLTISDADDANLSGATVQITGNYRNGQDTLSFIDQNGITSSWNAATGTLTLTGSATVTQYQSALRSITYSNSSDAPDTGARTISVTTTDGGDNSNTATRSVSVASVNDTPGAIAPPSYNAAEQTALPLHGTGLSVSDVDANSGNVQVVLSVVSGALTASAGGTGVTVSGSGSSSITLTGTVAQINSLLSGSLSGTLSYLISSDAPPATDTLTLSVNDLGNTGAGGALTATGTATINITAVNDAPGGSVSVTGAPTQGQILTASNTLTDADGMGTVSYQWLRNGVAVSGATGSAYALTQADVGATLSVTASYTDAYGQAESMSSTSTAAVANINDAPNGSVLISGSPAQGQTLTATNTLTDADGLGTISYQWLRNGLAVNGATGSTYALTQADVGAIFAVTASYTDDFGQAESMSSANTTAVANINDAPTGSVSISGTPAQGQTLTVSNTLADIDGLGTISYQWVRNGVAVSGTTGSSYTLTQADVGAVFAVTANYTDGFGQAESMSSANTAAVANVNDAPTVSGAWPDQTAVVGGQFVYALDTSVFNDIDGDPLTLSTSALPAWLQYDAGTGTLRGTPQPTHIGTINLIITASDGQGGSVSAPLNVVVPPISLGTGNVNGTLPGAGGPGSAPGSITRPEPDAPSSIDASTPDTDTSNGGNDNGNGGSSSEPSGANGGSSANPDDAGLGDASTGAGPGRGKPGEQGSLNADGQAARAAGQSLSSNIGVADIDRNAWNFQNWSSLLVTAPPVEPFSMVLSGKSLTLVTGLVGGTITPHPMSDPLEEQITTPLERLTKNAPVSVETGGLILSLGSVWWAARGAGLLTGLLATTPVWRQIDPLPVMLTRDEEPDDKADPHDPLDRAEAMFADKTEQIDVIS